MAGVPGYGRVRAKGVYPGVDVVFYGRDGMIEYDFVVLPKADPNQIRIRFGGAAKLSVDPSGDLVIGTGKARFAIGVRLCIEKDGRRTQVAGTYELEKGHRVRFQLGAYDTARPVVIDPVLTYNTYLGGSGDKGPLWGCWAVDYDRRHLHRG